MRRASWAVVLAAVVALTAAGALGQFVLAGHDPGRRATGVRTDVFGIRDLRPSLAGGTTWVAEWGAPRHFAGVDPEDPWFDAAHGAGTFTAAGGLLWITGAHPRMYVHDPESEKQWGDVEITMYVKRIADTGVLFSGFTAVARSNHLETEPGSGGRCDTRGYGARLRFDGNVDFEKETAHPSNRATGNRQIFAAGMPAGTWIGVKYLVFDGKDGVHLELWLDRTDGAGGGTWVRVNRYVDRGDGFGVVPCAAGVDPAAPLTRDPGRRGSESGKPNLSVYFRADGIRHNGLVYKWGSVREIDLTNAAR